MYFINSIVYKGEHFDSLWLDNLRCDGYYLYEFSIKISIFIDE